MNRDKKRILTEAIQAIVMAMGREENAIEFYGYLAKTTQISNAKTFFNDLKERETDDYNVMNTFLSKLKKEEEGNL